MGGAGVPASVIERSWPSPRLAAAGHAVRGGRRSEEWLAWHRQVDNGHEGTAGGGRLPRARTGRIVPVADSPLTVFFPTEKETFAGFLIQGPYRTTPSRDNIPGHDPSNQALVRETAVLLTDVLRELRDNGVLTVEALRALPLDAARFPDGSMFRPLFDAVGEALAAGELFQGQRSGRRLPRRRRAGTGGRRGVDELLGPDQLGALLRPG